MADSPLPQSLLSLSLCKSFSRIQQNSQQKSIFKKDIEVYKFSTSTACVYGIASMALQTFDKCHWRPCGIYISSVCVCRRQGHVKRHCQMYKKKLLRRQFAHEMLDWKMSSQIKQHIFPLSNHRIATCIFTTLSCPMCT